jgi:hypothetical protein
VELFTIRDTMTPCSFTEKSPAQDGEESGQKSAYPVCMLTRPDPIPLPVDPLDDAGNGVGISSRVNPQATDPKSHTPVYHHTNLGEG